MSSVLVPLVRRATADFAAVGMHRPPLSAFTIVARAQV
jgi:hypothetical protein